jgi:hypothetical protein
MAQPAPELIAAPPQAPVPAVLPAAYAQCRRLTADAVQLAARANEIAPAPQALRQERYVKAMTALLGMPQPQLHEHASDLYLMVTAMRELEAAPDAADDPENTADRQERLLLSEALLRAARERQAGGAPAVDELPASPQTLGAAAVMERAKLHAASMTSVQAAVDCVKRFGKPPASALDGYWESRLPDGTVSNLFILDSGADLVFIINGYPQFGQRREGNRIAPIAGTVSDAGTHILWDDRTVWRRL